MISSQGKTANGLETDLMACDAAGSGIWTYLQMPGGRKAEPVIVAATGKSGNEVRALLKSCGYAFYNVGQCWRTRANGTPARGRHGKATHAYRHALGDDG